MNLIALKFFRVVVVVCVLNEQENSTVLYMQIRWGSTGSVNVSARKLLCEVWQGLDFLYPCFAYLGANQLTHIWHKPRSSRVEMLSVRLWAGVHLLNVLLC